MPVSPPRATLAIIVSAGLTLGGIGYLLRGLPEMVEPGGVRLRVRAVPGEVAAGDRRGRQDVAAARRAASSLAPQATVEARVPVADPSPSSGVMKALYVLSASPDAAQIAPIVEQMSRDARFEMRVCVAAQAGSHSEGVLDLFDLSADVRITLAEADDVAQVTSAALGSLDRVISDFHPDVVVVPAGAPTSVATTLAATLPAHSRSHASNRRAPWCAPRRTRAAR